MANFFNLNGVGYATTCGGYSASLGLVPKDPVKLAAMVNEATAMTTQQVISIYHRQADKAQRADEARGSRTMEQYHFDMGW